MRETMTRGSGLEESEGALLAKAERPRAIFDGFCGVQRRVKSGS